jgi:hypothetical protein
MSTREVRQEYVRTVHDCDACGTFIDHSPDECKICGGEFCTNCNTFIPITVNGPERAPIWGGMRGCNGCLAGHVEHRDRMQAIGNDAVEKTMVVLTEWQESVRNGDKVKARFALGNRVSRKATPRRPPNSCGPCDSRVSGGGTRATTAIEENGSEPPALRSRTNQNRMQQPPRKAEGGSAPAVEQGFRHNGDLIVEFLKKNGPTKLKEIREGTGIARGSMTSAMKDPRITKVSHGVFQFVGSPANASPAHDPLDDEDDDEQIEAADPPPERPTRASLTGDMVSDALGTGKLSTVDLCSVLKNDRVSVLYVLNNDERFDMNADGEWFVK